MVPKLFSILCFLLFLKTIKTLACNFGYVSNGTHCEECGLTDYQANLRIVGGIQAIPNSWPSHVLLRINVKLDYVFPDGYAATISETYECGGTLINHYTVLTAAHCLIDVIEYDYNGDVYNIPVNPNKYYPTVESMLKIYFGLHDHSKFNSISVVQRSVSKAIKHPNYDDYNQLNDISLLMLDRPIEYTNSIKPACLPPSSDVNYPKLNSNSYAIGWGTTSEYGSVSNVLMNVMLTIYDPSYCSNVLSNLIKDWKKEICSGIYSGGKDTCQGDSGGGLYVFDNSTIKTRRVVVGITSTGDGCARKYLPGLYTRVSYYLDWIYANWMVNNASSEVPITTTTTTTTTTTSTTTTMTTSSSTTTTAIKLTTSLTTNADITSKITIATISKETTTKKNPLNNIISNLFQSIFNFFVNIFKARNR